MQILIKFVCFTARRAQNIQNKTTVTHHGHCFYLSILYDRKFAILLVSNRTYPCQTNSDVTNSITYKSSNIVCWQTLFSITTAGMPCKKKKKKKKEEEEEKKADLTTVLHIRELPHLHMKLAVWFSFLTTNNKNPMIPS